MIYHTLMGALMLVAYFSAFWGFFRFVEWIIYPETTASKWAGNITVLLVLLGLSYLTGIVFLGK
jgi:hypothetical protein